MQVNPQHQRDERSRLIAERESHRVNNQHLTLYSCLSIWEDSLSSNSSNEPEDLRTHFWRNSLMSSDSNHYSPSPTWQSPSDSPINVLDLRRPAAQTASNDFSERDPPGVSWQNSSNNPSDDHDYFNNSGWPVLDEDVDSAGSNGNFSHQSARTVSSDSSEVRSGSSHGDLNWTPARTQQMRDALLSDEDQDEVDNISTIVHHDVAGEDDVESNYGSWQDGSLYASDNQLDSERTLPTQSDEDFIEEQEAPDDYVHAEETVYLPDDDDWTEEEGGLMDSLTDVEETEYEPNDVDSFSAEEEQYEDRDMDMEEIDYHSHTVDESDETIHLSSADVEDEYVMYEDDEYDVLYEEGEYDVLYEDDVIYENYDYDYEDY